MLIAAIATFEAKLTAQEEEVHLRPEHLSWSNSATL